MGVRVGEQEEVEGVWGGGGGGCGVKLKWGTRGCSQLCVEQQQSDRERDWRTCITRK